MKKIVSLILIIALFFTALVGCNDNSPQETKTNSNKAITTYTTEGKKTKLVPDPDATGELTISTLTFYQPDNAEDYYNIALNMYKEMYPKVKVNFNAVDYQSMDYTQYATKLSTEVMSGKGPDLFWTVGGEIDTYKLMESGAMADLTSYFENDSNFNISDYNESVFYGGQMEGKQYVVPLNYQIPLFLTTKKIANETAFNVSKCTDYFSCSEEIARIAKENKLGCQPRSIVNEFYFPYYCPEYMGIDWLNLNANTVNLNNPEIKKAYKMLKDNYFSLLNTNDGSINMMSGVSYQTNFRQKDIIFSEMTLKCFSDVIMNLQSISTVDEEPILFPWRDVSGKIQSACYNSVAVSANSKNIQNAYNFVKILINPEFLAKVGTYDAYAFMSIPISKVATKQYLDSKKEKSKRGTEELNGLSQEFIDQYMGYISEVDTTRFGSNAVQMLSEIMQPYLEGKKTYEECIKEAQQKLEIYISE